MAAVPPPAEVDEAPAQPSDADRRRRTLLLMIIGIVLGLIVFQSLATGRSPSKANAGIPFNPALSPREKVWTAVGAMVHDTATGPVYPAKLSSAQHFSGEWALTPDSPPAVEDVSPVIADGVTVAYGVTPAASMSSQLGLNSTRGGVSMTWNSEAPFDSAPHVHRLVGSIKLGDSRNAFVWNANGIYLADEGLLLAVATVSPSVGVVVFAGAGNATAREMSDTGATFEALSHVADRGLQGGQGADGHCDVIFALRFRPIHFDPAQPTPSPAPTPSAGPQAARFLSAAMVTDMYPGAAVEAFYGRAISANCRFAMNITAGAVVQNIPKIDAKALGYGGMAIVASMMLLGLTTYQVLTLSSTGAFRVSLISVGLQSVMDAYLCITHMMGALVSLSAFSAFATASFLNMVLFSIVQMRFLMFVWKARHPDAFSGSWERVRHEIGSLYLRFYGAVALGLVLLYFGRGYTFEFVIFILMSYWVPQIIHSVQQDSRPGLTVRYVLLISLARLSFPAYMFMCPNNILFTLQPAETLAAALAWSSELTGADWLRGAVPGTVRSGGFGWLPAPDAAPALASPSLADEYWSSFTFGCVLVGWMLLQVTVVLLQGKTEWGPRFFIPAVFLPQKYNYHRSIVVVNGRVMPDPAATRDWVRAVEREDASPANTVEPVPGAVAPAPPSLAARATTYVMTWLASTRRRVLSTAATSQATAVWFVHCCQLLLIDWSVRGRRWARNFMKPTHARTRMRGYEQVGAATTSGASAGATAPQMDDAAGAAPDVEADADPQRVYLREIVTGTRAGVASPVVEGSSTARSSSASQPGGTGEGTPTGEAAVAVDCVVCMDTVTFPVARHTYMVTPCDHLFHTTCLRTWMEQKMECPTCRMQLPEPGPPVTL